MGIFIDPVTNFASFVATAGFLIVVGSILVQLVAWIERRTRMKKKSAESTRIARSEQLHERVLQEGCKPIRKDSPTANL